MATINPLIVSLVLLLSIVPAHAEIFNIPSGDVSALIAAINTANSNGQDNTINVTGTYTLTSVNDPTDGGNGLPSITSTMTIDGGTGATIKRSDGSGIPLFRVVRVAENGNLTANGLTVEGGSLPHVNVGREGIGGGILSLGDLTITESSIVHNSAGDDAGGIAVVAAGSTVVVRNSIISGNSGGNGQNVGGIIACCSVSIRSSTISENQGVGLAISGVDEHGEFNEDIVSELVDSFVFHNHGVGREGGIGAGGNVAIVNSTIAENIGGSGSLDAAAVFLQNGKLSLVNNTISNNSTPSLDPLSTGGILADPANNGRIELVNTILAGNTRTGVPSDCGGAPIISLGNNIIGSTAGCTITLLGSDQLGDPVLSQLTDDGTPGNGHYPLLDTSPAIDAGNNAVCLSNSLLATDQIGNPRMGVCDIGAIEFQPSMPVLIVAVDVRPGSPNNNINPKSNALMPVAILSANGFDTAAVDQSTLRFGPDQAVAERTGQFRDVDHDGLHDLILQFRIQDAGIQCGDTSVSIKGQTVDGEPIQGTDTIRTVGCNAKPGKKK